MSAETVQPPDAPVLPTAPELESGASNDDTTPYHMRITTHGKIRTFVKFALDFVEVNLSSRPPRTDV